MANAVRKSSQAFRTISEVAEELDVPQHVLRFWESKFSQVKPMKRGGGRRYYRPEDIDLLRGIRTLLYEDGFTIKGVQKVFRDRGVRFIIDTGKPGANRTELPREHAKPAYVEEDADVATPKSDSAQEKARHLTIDQRRQLDDALGELMQLKSLLQAAKGSAALTRTVEDDSQAEKRSA
mgnify:CR=1 FL=1